MRRIFPAQSKYSLMGSCDHVSFNEPTFKGGQNTEFINSVFSIQQCFL